MIEFFKGIEISFFHKALNTSFSQQNLIRIFMFNFYLSVQ